ncbi:protein-serine O-palmitoleoyltransferase porcupine isoform X2 [Agrilus planipennis]|uniref:Protein-serine O-palmitoleoyltransferase porcupine isoform X2 n=1 Tax=Agrilus planipennis TaxID=224129 RepID=A0A1W4X8L1_AGRPL|nr:protein-serine O-palmitoleoyltransferase porcupine isoform X2 [Agrilus planipennis]
MDSEDRYYYDYTPTVYEVFEYCVFPSINGILPTLKNLIIINFLFNVSIQSRLISETTYNGLSILLGFLLLFFTLPELSILCIVGFICLTYVFLLTICKIQKHRRLNLEYLTGFVCAIVLVICEFGFNSDTWIQLRGFFMIACMKIISFTSDLQRGEEYRSVLFFGYILCPANCLFGPWVSVGEYKTLYKNPGKKNFNWATRIICSLLNAVFFLTLSNCWGTYFIPDGSFKWFEAYRQALSFRSSHYFISYLSETSMIIAGFNNKKNEQKKGHWSYEITHPLDIEIPSSLMFTEHI